jgi:hypothetical protein
MINWEGGVLKRISFGIILFVLLMAVMGSGIEASLEEEDNLIWIKTSNPAIGWDEVYGVAVDGTGLYVVGCDWSPGDRQWRIERRKLNDGDLIGAVTYNPSTEDERAYGVAIYNTGLYVVGDDYSLGKDDAQWRIEKRMGTLVIPEFPSAAILTVIAMALLLATVIYKKALRNFQRRG